MNTHCYRLIFSKKLGFLIPVAETTCAAGKPGQTRGPSWSARWLLKALPLALLGVLPYTRAEIVIAPAQRASMAVSAGGVPVMEINNPNASGLSHNRLSEFNVAQPGLIFNNSLRDGTSQIGGHVMHNPNLTREARAILTEVTGNTPSTLEGTLEVFGGRADIFIANPNGLSLNGVSTYNASGLAVTTGQVVLGGNGPQFRVDDRSGRVLIGSAGVNTEGLSYFDIVARAIELQGEVGSASRGTDIMAISGLNTYDATSRTHSKDADSGSNAPVIAIDGSAAGAMHGSFITLVSTESGAGVRHQGVVRSARNIEISANGDIALTHLDADNDLKVRGHAVTLGTAQARQDVSLDSEGAVQANALRAGGNARLNSWGAITLGDGQTGNGLTAGGLLEMKSGKGIVINNDVRVDRFTAQADSLLINAATLEAIGAQLTGSAKAITITVNDFTLTGAIQAISSANQLLPISQPVSIRDGKLQADLGAGQFDPSIKLATTALLKSGGGIAITSQRLHNDQGVIEDTSTRGITITTDSLRNQGLIQSGGDVVLTAATVENLCFAGASIGAQAQSICAGLLAGGNGDLKIGQLTNEGGLAANGRMALELGHGTHTSGASGEIGGSQGLALTQASGQQANLQNAGRLQAGTENFLAVLDGLVNLGGSQLSTGKQMNLQISKDLVAGGELLAAHGLAITAENLLITATSVINTGGDASMQTTQNLTQEKGSTLHTSGDLLMAAGKNLTTSADIFVGGQNATLSAQEHLLNRNGSLLSVVNLLMNSGGTLTNEDNALVYAANRLLMQSTGDMYNRSGSTVSSGNLLQLKAGGVLHNDSASLTGNVTTLEAQRVVNSQGASIHGGDSLTIQSREDVRNETGSVIRGSKTVSIAAGGTLSNDQASITATDLILHGNDITNSNQGELFADTLRATAQNTFASQSGAVARARTVFIDANRFDASASHILATEDIDLHLREFYNTATVHSKDTATVTMKDGTSLVIGPGHHNPTADTLLTLNTHDLTVHGSLSNPGAIRVRATGDVLNNGEILTGKWLDVLAAGSIDNLGKKLIWAAEDMWLKAGDSITNASGALIRATNGLTLLATKAVINQAGRIDAGKDVAIDTALLENRSDISGDITADGTVHTDNWYAEDWGLNDSEYFHTEFWIPRYSGANLLVRQGVIQAGADLLINQNAANSTQASVRNLGGQVLAAKNIRVDGNLENLGVAKSVSLVDMLKNTSAFAQWEVSESSRKDGPSLHTNMFDLFDKNLLATDYVPEYVVVGHGTGGEELKEVVLDPSEITGNYIKDLVTRAKRAAGFAPGQVIKGTEKWMFSLRKTATAEGNALMSAVFGADWKNLNHATMRERWIAFKAAPESTLEVYADKQAELSAGQRFVHTGGSLLNGTGANWGQNRVVDVQIGDEKLKTVAGELNAQFNRNSAFEFKGTDYLTALREATNAANILKGLLEDNPLFNPNGRLANAQAQVDPLTGLVTPGYQGVYPLYTSRVSFKKDDFYGSEYLFGKLGYNPDKTVTVLGDAYLDNELIVRTIENTVGNFFAVNRQLSGASLVQKLMDNAADQMTKLGLHIGQPLTQDQYERLDSDIVWYEPQLVNGISVLAPKVYVSKNTLLARQHDQHSGALITAQNVLIDATAVDNINGIIRGTNDTLVYAEQDINNVSQGGTDTGIYGGDHGRLAVAAQGKVHNQGGNLQGFEQTVVGGDGVTSSATTGFNDDGNLKVRNNGILGVGITVAGAPQDAAPAASPPGEAAASDADAAPAVAASPVTPILAKPDARAIFEAAKQASADGAVAADAGSSLAIISGGDLNLIGAHTIADKVKLQAGGDLTMEDIHEVSSDFTSSLEHGFLSFQTTRVTTAKAISKGNQVSAGELSIDVGGDWKVTGSDVTAHTSTVNVAGDATVTAGKNAANYEKVQKTVQILTGATAGSNGHEATGSAKRFDTQQAATGASAFEYSDQDLKEYAGAASGANQNRGDTAGVRFRWGIEIVDTKETIQDTTHTNAQLDLGNGTLQVGGTFDLGGADINKAHQLSAEQRAGLSGDELAAVTAAMPTLDIRAGAIESTKAKDTHKQTFNREELFLGSSTEIHSSFVNVATHINKTADKANDGMETDPALTAAAEIGNVTQLVFGDTLGSSTTLGLTHTKSKSEAQRTADTINQIGGNISLTSTKGDITLNGVNIQGGKVALDSAGAIHQRAAQASSSGKSSTDIHTAGLVVAASVSPMGAGIGVSVGASGNYDRTEESGTTHTNGAISGADVSLRAKGDHTMEGATLQAGHLDYAIDGTQVITSKQNASNMDHVRGSWSAAGGVAVSALGVVPTGSASASGGKDYDNSKLTAQQSGITANSMNLHIGGDQKLTGAHVINTTGKGSYQVDGTLTANTLADTRDKDGGYAGGGGGISKSGLPTVVVEAGRVDQVKYEATQKSTVDLGGMDMTVGSVVGSVNTDANKKVDVTQDRKIAGTDVKVEISMADLKKKKKTDSPTAKQVDDDQTIKGPTTTDVPVIKHDPVKTTDTNARHMTAATTGNQLKNALSKLNSANRADQAALKSHPVEITLRGADGKLTTHEIKDANSLKALHGQLVVTGERAEHVNRAPGLGQSSRLYIKVVPQPGGGFTTTFTPNPPKPL
jgi:filamentous hemagglutinin